MIKNKNGWGFIEMIALIGILLFFFLLSIVLIISFYRSINNKELNVDVYKENTSVYVSSYQDLESKMEEAANKYISSKYSSNSNVDSIIIENEKLLNLGYYSNVGYEDCNGYVISNIKDGIVSSDAYIKCNKYITEGYGD